MISPPSFVDPRRALRDAGLTPKKSFGQNFLVAVDVLEAIGAACVPDGEVGRACVVEIGAGTGALTQVLLGRAAHLSAIERDRDLVPLLRARFASAIEGGTLVVVEGDAQAFDLRAALAPYPSPRVLCGNLPYQLTGKLLEAATHAHDVVDRACFLVQLEVADRLAARPSTKDYGALSVFVQAAFAVRRVRVVPPGAFHPPPEVTSAVVVLDRHALARAEETETFRWLVRAAFGQRRKTLRNAWSRHPRGREAVAAAAEIAAVSLDARGETLEVEAFARVAAALDASR